MLCVFLTGGNECNCHEVLVMLERGKCAVGRGAILGLVGRLGLGKGRHGGDGCHSCGKRVNGVTSGLLGERFTTAGPFRGLTASMARFGIYGSGMCLSPMVSLCGQRVISCSVSLDPGLRRVERVLSNLFGGLPTGTGPLFRSSRN